jgi:hypothetical protein
VPSAASHDLTMHRSIEELRRPIDVAIVATNSDVRRQVVEQLLDHVVPDHLVLEKFLFQAPADYGAVGALTERAGTRTWVNTARRMWPAYSALRTGLDTLGPVSLRIIGTVAHGLGSNAVHFVDLQTYLTGRACGRFFGDLLVPLESHRRPGHIEFSGSLAGANDFGDQFTFTVLPDPGAPLLVEMTTRTEHVVIEEGGGTVAVADEAGQWAWRTEPFTMTLQSELTARLVTELMQEGICPLPTLQEASRSHLALLEAFLASYRRHVDVEAVGCPVT